MARVKKRGKINKNDNRRGKKKTSVLTTQKVEYVDWKDVDLLRRFVSERSKIRARRVSGNNAQQQKMVADAIKLAREMALIPYATRVTSQRSNRDRGDRGDRGPRQERPRRDEEASAEAAEETTDNATAVAEVEGVEFNAADSEGAE